MTTRILLLNESYELLSRLHAMFMRLESTRFDSDENSEYFEKLLRVQDRAFWRNRRRSDAWEAEFEMEWSALIAHSHEMLSRTHELLTNSGACAAPLAITPDRSIDATLPVSMASGQGGTYPGTCHICGETYDDLDASRTCTQCAATRAIQCRAIHTTEFTVCDFPDCSNTLENQLTMFGGFYA